jgi:hypothetical protein
MISLGRYEVVSDHFTTIDLLRFDYVFIDWKHYVEVFKQRGKWKRDRVDPEPGTLPKICARNDIFKELEKADRPLAVLWIPESALRKKR